MREYAKRIREIAAKITIAAVVILIVGLIPKVAQAKGEFNEDYVYATIVSMKAAYPEGMTWTNDNYYRWNGGIYSGGYGCAGFAFRMSDEVFGTLPARILTEKKFSEIHPGDILRINNDTHSVIVLRKTDTYVEIAEGNYGGTIHWGRLLYKSNLESGTLTYIMTRYPEDYFDPEEVPVEIDMTLSNEANGVRVSWDSVQNAAKYRVYRKVDGGAWSTLKYSTSVSFVDGTVESGKSYTYGIRCMDSTGNYLNDLEENATIVFVSNTPEITLTQVDGGVLISWNSVAGAVKYRVYRKTADGAWASIKYATGTSVKDTGLEYDIEYVYGVRCLDSNGKYMNPLEEGGSIIYVNNSPEITLTQVGSGIQISWAAVPGAAKYRIYKKTAGGAWASLKYSTGTSVKDTAVSYGTEYIYGIRCLDANGKYLNALEEGGSILYKNNSPTVTVKAVSGGNQVSWTSVDGAVKYRVYRKVSGGQWQSLQYSAKLSIKDSNITPGSEYTYGVRCIDANGKYMNDLQ